MTSPETSTASMPQRRPLREIVAYFLRLGTWGFGGPVALVGLMEKELVQERQWLTRDDKNTETGTISAGNTVLVIRFA